MNGSKKLNNQFIGASQLSKMLFLFALGTAGLMVPTFVVAIAKQDAWISMAIAGPLNYIVLLLYLALAERFPGLTLAQYAEKLLGTWLGKALTLVYVCFFLLLSALVLRNIVDFLGLSVLPGTPNWVIAFTFMLVIVYGAYLGIETIARSGELLFGWTVLVIFIIMLLLTNQFEPKNFEPFVYEGWTRPFKGLYPILGFPLGEFVVMSAFFPFVKQADVGKLRKHLKLAAMFVGIFSVGISVLLLGVLGVDETRRSPFSIFDMAKTINVEDVIVRVEVTVAIVWVSTVFMKLMMSFYGATLLAAQMLNLKSYRPLIVPFTFVVVPLSIAVYRNSAHAEYFAMQIWTPFSLTIGVAIPMLLLLFAFITGKRTARSKGDMPVKASYEAPNDSPSGGKAQQSGAGQAGGATPS
ncbi:GerAB/ArcD/ProY family transporter [Paenibacillus radicis (ex Gao et al. 2016)]|uniref:Germination protein n=1 Tax=Paenibacillus radicis (ex Gao et al. 2016) TaxID=1737354 RepID=A0A917M8Y5_9BACL|nr:endospore germination permease [Paenibacillus radicis (ex Gao et al. 2016)]GGG84955.1 germination protein [Paenibacillus radicis (ex Gao et al. 2016)]